jgi:hypothetical protein
MQRTPLRSGLLAAVMVAPLLAGCTALGLPDDPAGFDVPARADVVDPAATPAPLPSPVQVSSNDGYSVTLPAGWVGGRTNNDATRGVLEAIAAGDGLLGAEAVALYDSTDADLSMIAADASQVGRSAIPPVMAILVIPAQRGSEDTEQRVDDVLASLTTLSSEVERSVASVRAGDARRYDLTVAGDFLTVQLRVYLFTIGDDGIVVMFGADPAVAADATSDIEAIVKSLRFGV